MVGTAGGPFGEEKKKHRGTRLPGVTKQVRKGVCMAHGDPIEGVNIDFGAYLTVRPGVFLGLSEPQFPNLYI